MAKFAFRGLEEYELKLSKWKAGSEKISGKAIYGGAGIVADAIRKNIEALPEQHLVGVMGVRKVEGVTPEQKEGLLDGLGITPMQEKKGYYNVKVGFDGYNSTKTDKYPKGQPNVLIARAVESGTSFRQKNRFVHRAVSASRDAAVKKMQQVIDDELEKLF